ncbi:MAG: SDR family oxidoreductase [bacterium]|nr:SDR family oxidoreductase [bacterium]MDT8365176.1 SDR family oxidoreductase [bacterium]
MEDDRLILLTAASGYIGGRLLSDLEDRGERVRCLVRHPVYMRSRIEPRTQIVGGDVLDPESLEKALEGVHTAYYLVHSLGGGEDYEEKDQQAASNFGKAALKASVRQIIYLGNLGRGEDLSPYLASRQEVGRILRESGVPTIEFQSSIIIGSGSLSYEMVRGLVERLPIMIAPRWVRSKVQPIAVEDVLVYLIQALDLPEPENRIYEVGGADISSYEGVLRQYARQRGLRRIIISIPLLTPQLSSHWLSLVTPLYYKVGHQLVEGVRNERTVQDPKALEVFPLRPMGLTKAMSRAMSKEDHQFAKTHWSDALPDIIPGHHWWGMPFDGRRVDSYHRILPYSPEEVFTPIQCVGGEHGWYGCNWMWKIRGAMDRLIGGVGLRRGRRELCDIRVGDAIDFWRVEKYVENTHLLLYAEMKLPGRAWLYFEVGPNEKGAEVRMTAVFDPMGVWGRVYWYLVYPFHYLVFNSMFKGIVRAIEQNKKECVV